MTGKESKTALGSGLLGGQEAQGALSTLLTAYNRLKEYGIAFSELPELLRLEYHPRPKETTHVQVVQEKSDQQHIEPAERRFAPQVINYPPKNLFLPFPCLYTLEKKAVKDSSIMPAEYTRLTPFQGKIEFPEVSAVAVPQPLTGWHLLWPYLRRLGLEVKQTSRLDNRKIIASAVKQRPLTTIPWQEKQVWPLDIVLLLDFSRYLSPFFADFKQLALDLQRWFRQRLHIVVCADVKTDAFFYRDEMYRGFPPKLDHLHLIYAGDLGFLDRQGSNAGFWYQFGRRLQKKQIRMDALVTAHPSDWIAATARLFSVHYWDFGVLRPGGHAGQPRAGQGKQSREQAEKLLAALAQAIELTPALVRQVRIRLGLNVSTESLVFSHPVLEGNALRFQWRKPFRQEYSNKARQLYSDLELEQLWSQIKEFEGQMPVELRIEQRQKAEKPLEPEQREFLQKVLLFLLNRMTPEREKDKIIAWMGRVAERAGEEAWLPEMNNLYGVYNKQVKPEQFFKGVDLTQVEDWVVQATEPQSVYLSVRQGQLFFSSQQPPDHPGLIHKFSIGSKSQIIFNADKQIKRPIVLDKPYKIPENTSEIIVETDTAKTTVAMMRCPEWAEGIGRDQYGLFAEVKVKGCSFLLRWIPPGEFMMGSPEDEPGRFDEEGPQHRVVLETGFWLAETACTQELWQAITGNNPSKFKKEGLQHPVENISWDDANDFIKKLNHLVLGLELRLPSEAEWEYACRAGTDTPFWFGWELTPDKANYDGTVPYNNGPKGKWREKTVPVKSFKQNPWGLYQMHGNVWEWCQDRWHNNYDRTPDDDGAPDNGSAWEKGKSDSRVCRGGSWFFIGRFLRSACRGSRRLGIGIDDFGLRLARGPQEPDAGTGGSRKGTNIGIARDEHSGVSAAGGDIGDSQ